MENKTYFKIDSVEELVEAYNHFKHEWHKYYTLKDEIKLFKNCEDYKYIAKNYSGNIYLTTNIFFGITDYREILNPLKYQLNGTWKVENKYQVKIKGVDVDVYDVLKAFDITCPATQHAIKKLLKAGKRGYKDAKQDLDEAITSINRAKQLQND